jgi:hypothetical protein
MGPDLNGKSNIVARDLVKSYFASIYNIDQSTHFNFRINELLDLTFISTARKSKIYSAICKKYLRSIRKS